MKQIKREIIDNVPVGLYHVVFDTIWGSVCNEGKHDDCLSHGCLDNEPSYIAEIEPIVTLVTEENYLSLNVINKDENFNADKLWQGDTHDLRPRLFKTLVDAENHVTDTMDRWKFAQPWEVFVKTA